MNKTKLNRNTSKNPTFIFKENQMHEVKIMRPDKSKNDEFKISSMEQLPIETDSKVKFV